jgi:hypothetical protein
MRVKLKTTVAGPDGIYPPGTIYEGPACHALVRGGFAEWVDPPKTETAVIPYQTVTRRGRK